MKLTETVQHVKRDKLPRDPVWLGNRIDRLISIVKHERAILHELNGEIREFKTNHPPKEWGELLFSLYVPKVDYNVNIQGIQFIIGTDTATRLRELQLTTKFSAIGPSAVPKKFPKAKRVKYHQDSYDYHVEDLGRTVRSVMRMKK